MEMLKCWLYSSPVTYMTSEVAIGSIQNKLEDRFHFRTVVKGTDIRVILPRFVSWLHHLLAV